MKKTLMRLTALQFMAVMVSAMVIVFASPSQAAQCGDKYKRELSGKIKANFEFYEWNEQSGSSYRGTDQSIFFKKDKEAKKLDGVETKTNLSGRTDTVAGVGSSHVVQMGYPKDEYSSVFYFSDMFLLQNPASEYRPKIFYQGPGKTSKNGDLNIRLPDDNGDLEDVVARFLNKELKKADDEFAGLHVTSPSRRATYHNAKIRVFDQDRSHLTFEADFDISTEGKYDCR